MTQPLHNNAIRECPHCGAYKQLTPTLLELWPDSNDEDKYYMFHEPEEFLNKLWKEVENG